MTKKSIILTSSASVLILAGAIFAYSHQKPVTPTTNGIVEQLDQLATWRIETPIEPALDPFGECKTGSSSPISKYTQLNTNDSTPNSDSVYLSLTSNLKSTGWTEVSCQDTQSTTYQKSSQFIKIIKPTPDTSLTLYLQ